MHSSTHCNLHKTGSVLCLSADSHLLARPDPRHLSACLITTSHNRFHPQRACNHSGPIPPCNTQATDGALLQQANCKSTRTAEESMNSHCAQTDNHNNSSPRRLSAATAQANCQAGCFKSTAQGSLSHWHRLPLQPYALVHLT